MWNIKLPSWLSNPLIESISTESVELGDDLDPTFVHRFTQAEIADEMKMGGFELVYFREQPYGHAVGLAEWTINWPFLCTVDSIDLIALCRARWSVSDASAKYG